MAAPTSDAPTQHPIFYCLRLAHQTAAMTPEQVDLLLARIRRAEATARQCAALGCAQSNRLIRGQLHHYTFNGIKSPEQFEDELLIIFVWLWSLKDYLKEAYKAKGLDPQRVEDAVNESAALQYVSDIANRAKHGTLRGSRSGKSAELIDVGFTIPQGAMECITFGAHSVSMDVGKPDKVELRATIKTGEGIHLDAFSVLQDAMEAWERRVIGPIAG